MEESTQNTNEDLPKMQLAIRHNDFDRVMCLFFNVNSNGLFLSALNDSERWDCKARNEVIKYALSLDTTNVNVRDSKGRPALLLAILDGNEEAMKMILDHRDFDPNIFSDVVRVLKGENVSVFSPTKDISYFWDESRKKSEQRKIELWDMFFAAALSHAKIDLLKMVQLEFANSIVTPSTLLRYLDRMFTFNRSTRECLRKFMKRLFEHSTMNLIPSADYTSFSKFVNKIEDEELQKIWKKKLATLEVNSDHQNRLLDLEHILLTVGNSFTLDTESYDNLICTKRSMAASMVDVSVWVECESSIEFPQQQKITCIKDTFDCGDFVEYLIKSQLSTTHSRFYFSDLLEFTMKNVSINGKVELEVPPSVESLDLQQLKGFTISTIPDSVTHLVINGTKELCQDDCLPKHLSYLEITDGQPEELDWGGGKLQRLGSFDHLEELRLEHGFQNYGDFKIPHSVESFYLGELSGADDIDLGPAMRFVEVHGADVHNYTLHGCKIEKWDVGYENIAPDLYLKDGATVPPHVLDEFGDGYVRNPQDPTHLAHPDNVPHHWGQEEDEGEQDENGDADQDEAEEESGEGHDTEESEGEEEEEEHDDSSEEEQQQQSPNSSA